MNIVILTNEHPKVNNAGGIATFNQMLAQSLESFGHTVTFLLPNFSNNHASSDKRRAVTLSTPHFNSLLLHILESRPLALLAKKSGLNEVLKSIRISFLHYIELKKLLREQSIDVVHSELYFSPCLFASILLHRKIVFISHSHGSIRDVSERKTLESLLLFRLEQLQAYFSQKIISCSQSQLTRDTNYYQANKCITIPNPYAGKRYVPISSVSNAILFFGRIEKRKGVENLVAAFRYLRKKHSRLHLYIIGDNDLHVRSSACMTVLPRIDEKEGLFSLIRKINPIVILPAFFEPFGYTTLESLSLGCLTVASKHGGGSEIIEDGRNGFLCDSSVKSIVETLQKVLMLSDDHVLNIKRQAILTQKRYGLRKIGAQYEALYASL